MVPCCFRPGAVGGAASHRIEALQIRLLQVTVSKSRGRDKADLPAKVFATGPEGFSGRIRPAHTRYEALSVPYAPAVSLC